MGKSPGLVTMLLSSRKKQKSKQIATKGLFNTLTFNIKPVSRIALPARNSNVLAPWSSAC